MKKLISVCTLLCVMLALRSMMITSFAAEEKVSFVVSDAVCEVGEKATVTLSTTENPGFFGSTLLLAYNSDTELISAELTEKAESFFLTPELSMNRKITEITSIGNTRRMAMINCFSEIGEDLTGTNVTVLMLEETDVTSDYSEKSEIMKLTFKVNTEGTHMIYVLPYDCISSQYESITDNITVPCEAASGCIIAGKGVSPEKVVFSLSDYLNQTEAVKEAAKKEREEQRRLEEEKLEAERLESERLEKEKQQKEKEEKNNGESFPLSPPTAAGGPAENAEYGSYENGKSSEVSQNSSTLQNTSTKTEGYSSENKPTGDPAASILIVSAVSLLGMAVCLIGTKKKENR